MKAPRWTIVLSCVGLLLLVASLVLAAWALSISTRLQHTVSSLQASLNAPAATVTSTVSYSDMLAVYKEILQTSKDTLTSSTGMWTVVAAVITIIFSFLALSGAGVYWQLNKSYGEARKEVASLKSRYDDLDKSLTDLQDLAAKQKKQRLRLGTDLNQATERLQHLSEQVSTAENDYGIIPRLRKLMGIRSEATNLYSGDLERSRTGKLALVQFSEDDDPVVVLECVRSFRSMLRYPEAFDLWDATIIDQLRKLVKHPDRGVRLAATETLRGFEDARHAAAQDAPRSPAGEEASKHPGQAV